MGAPRKLWKTTIVVWSDFDPRTVETNRLIDDACNGGSIITKQDSELISDPYKQEDGPPEDFFEKEGQ